MSGDQLTPQILGRAAEKRGSKCRRAAPLSVRPLKVCPSKGPLEQRIEFLLVHRYSPPVTEQFNKPSGPGLLIEFAGRTGATARGSPWSDSFAATLPRPTDYPHPPPPAALSASPA